VENAAVPMSEKGKAWRGGEQVIFDYRVDRFEAGRKGMARKYTLRR